MTKTLPLLLIADDDPDDQYFFQEAIEVVCPGRVRTHFVFDGAQMMNFLHANQTDHARPRLVVLDLNMRVKDGRTSLLDIKSHPEFRDIPVVILTTSDNQEDKEYCLEHGASAYYQKPSSIMELVDIIRTLWKEYLS
jgi:CheY-like chemotaxis protein